MQIITESITHDELQQLAANLFGNMIKGVVDVDREIIAVDAELHSDLEALLLEDGSNQQSLWGINLYPEMPEDEFIEYDSLINIRPSQNNRSRGVEDEKIRRQIIEIVKRRIKS